MNIPKGTFRFLPVLLGALLTANCLQAQVNWLTDNRYVTVSGYAQIASQGISSNYSATATPSSSFAAFNGSITGEASVRSTVLSDSPTRDGLQLSVGLPLYGDSWAQQASQNSSLTGNEFSFSSLDGAYTDGGVETSFVEVVGDSVYAESDSYCQLTFNVNSPQTWNLILGMNSLVKGNIYAANASLQDSSSIQDFPLGFYPQSYSGTLIPGHTYTLTLDIRAVSNSGDPVTSAEIDYSADFSIVPEPSSYALLGIGLTGLFALRRKPFAKA
jgi:hypothetical protein